MYQKKFERLQMTIEDFMMPFGGHLSAENRWVKLAYFVLNGFAFMEQQSFDSFNEGISLIESAQTYKERFSYYPNATLADTIYRNRENRQFCKTQGIRLSGPRLGRPKPDELETDKKLA